MFFIVLPLPIRVVGRITTLVSWEHCFRAGTSAMLAGLTEIRKSLSSVTTMATWTTSLHTGGWVWVRNWRWFALLTLRLFLALVCIWFWFRFYCVSLTCGFDFWVWLLSLIFDFQFLSFILTLVFEFWHLTMDWRTYGRVCCRSRPWSLGPHWVRVGFKMLF